jgi:3-oxoacyl-[acyl-carrier-protein] synthase II
MAVYINGKGNVSPQKTWGDGPLLADPRDYPGSKLECVQPDYSQFVDVRQLRRMSRIIKMGVAAGTLALREAGVTIPDGIITGTGFGCLEDTGIFLTKMVESNESALNPTPFIQSTHNTIGSQIALLLQCQGYNQTYTQRAFSFENVLLDAILGLKENPAQSILAGGVDEITEVSHTIQKRFGNYRENSTSSLQLFNSGTNGTLQGEGAAYFVLSGEKQSQCNVSLESVATFYKPGQQLKDQIEIFLRSLGLSRADIDLLLIGKSGDIRFDLDAEHISSTLFTSSSTGLFKHLCGEHPTASAFGLWLGARIIEEQEIPALVLERNASRPIKNCLIYNPYFSNYHSLILLRAC